MGGYGASELRSPGVQLLYLMSIAQVTLIP